MSTIYDFQATELNGSLIDFANFKESIFLIVNTASNCGFTPQFAELEDLHK